MGRHRLRRVGYALLYSLLLVGVSLLVLGAVEADPALFFLGVLLAALVVGALLLPGPRRR